MSSKTLIRFSKGDPEKLSFCRSHGSSGDVIFYLCMHTEWLNGREKNAKNKNDLLTTGLNDIKKKKNYNTNPRSERGSECVEKWTGGKLVRHNVTSMLQITYAACWMKWVNLLYVPGTRNASLVFSGTAGGESSPSFDVDVDLWEENTGLKYKSLLS